MKFQSFTGRSVMLFLALFMLINLSPAAYAKLNGSWIQHPAACFKTWSKGSQVDRIIEGEKYVYFSVRGDYFNRTIRCHTTQENLDPILIFRYDKTLPWSQENIKALAQEFDLSGSFVSAINYSPERGVFVVAYENQGIDFIYDDGRQIKCKALSSVTNTASYNEIYSITFDLEKPIAYFACANGFHAIDYTTGELKESHIFDKQVAWAGRVGNNMVIIAGTFTTTQYDANTYIYPIDSLPAVLTDPIAGGVNTYELMPLTSNSFAVLTRANNSEAQNTLDLFNISSDGEISKVNLQGARNFYSGNNNHLRHLFQTDGYVHCSKDGYTISDYNNISFLKKGVEYTTLQEFKAEALKEITKSTAFTSNERYSKAASYNGDKIWLFTFETGGDTDMNPRGFYYRPFLESGWGEKSNIEKPNAPTSTFATYCTWTPESGLLLRGPGGYNDMTSDQPDYFCRYKDGKWTDLGYAANYVGKSYYELNKAPFHVEVDPINPDWIWGSSAKAGLFRIDITDYENNFFQLGSTNYPQYETSYPGYFALMAPQVTWKAIISISNVCFDKDSTMWFTRVWDYPDEDGTEFEDYNKATKESTPIYFFTADQRKEFIHVTAANTEFKQKLKEWTEKQSLVIPGLRTWHSGYLISMKAPGNENYIAYSSRTFSNLGQFFLYDHNGTPADPSDDRFVTASELCDENGNKLSYTWESSIYEDLKTGELWFCTLGGPTIFNPTEMLAGNKKGKSVRIKKRDGMEVDEMPFQYVSINKICDDMYGRKWLATTSGLYCLSQDNAELLGHYSVENSALPSDKVYNVVCDLQKGSVFALTDRGLAEFIPEDAYSSLPEGEHLSIWPTTLTPDYKGYVNITGTENGSTYVINDLEGNIVKTLGVSENGTFQWDGKNNNNAKVKAGKYIIKRADKEESHSIIILE